ncbi:MAG: methyltransferase [Clostridia bacterium]|nr:methyltransferase [Clostridia bacterium]
MEKLQYLGQKMKIYVSEIHRYGTDAVLLADFSMPKNGDKACDFGTGCGIIPLMWRLNGSNCDITAVDISRDACLLAEKSVSENGLKDIKIINGDLRNPKTVEGSGVFDVVSMNPPYKAATDGVMSENSERRTARHEVECTIEDLCAAAARLLRFGGKLCICQRPERLADIICAMRAAKIEPKRLRLVCQRRGGVPKLILVEGRLGSKSGLAHMPPLYIENDDGGVSDEIARIYGEYYIESGDKNER